MHDGEQHSRGQADHDVGEAADQALHRAERQLLAALDAVWQRGWLPGEVIRQATRTRAGGAGSLVRLAVAADHARRPPDSVHQRWKRHVTGLALPGVANSIGAIPEPAGWLRAGRDHLEIPLARCPPLADSVTMSLGWLRHLGVVIPPPGSAEARASAAGSAAGGGPTGRKPGGGASMSEVRSRRGAGSDADSGLDAGLNVVLDRVRALLAQAESTTFEAEAETFTAKAQELMARHSIDSALVWGASPSRGEPGMVRIPIDEPYLSAKTTLLHVVALSSHCRTVYYKGYALAVVVGFEADLVATETLYTSLLVQAQVALRQEAGGSRPGDHVRSRLFRSSFLYAFASRVGQRLTEVTSQVEAEAAAAARATGGGDLLPVLADRDALIQAKIRDELGPVGTTRARRSLDASGARAGSQAADRARLGRQGELRPEGPGLPSAP